MNNKSEILNSKSETKKKPSEPLITLMSQMSLMLRCLNSFYFEFAEFAPLSMIKKNARVKAEVEKLGS